MEKICYVENLSLKLLIAPIISLTVFAACENKAGRGDIDNQNAASAVAANSKQAPIVTSTPQAPSAAPTPQAPSAAPMPPPTTQPPVEPKASTTQEHETTNTNSTGQTILEEDSLALWAKRPLKDRKASVARWNREALAEANLNPSNLDMAPVDEAIRSCMEKYAADDPGASEVLDELFIRTELKSMAKATQRACLATLVGMAAD